MSASEVRDGLRTKWGRTIWDALSMCETWQVYQLEVVGSQDLFWRSRRTIF